MPIPVAMAAIVAAQFAGGLIQKGNSARLRRKAKKEFDEYEIPKTATMALDRAQSLASQRGVPGEDIYRSRAAASSARGVESAARFAQSPTDVLGLLSRMYGENMANFEQNMALSGMQAYERRQQNLMGALNKYAQFETEQWQYNELYPYMQAMGEAGQVDTAGNANIGSAMNSGMQMMGNQWDLQAQKDQFEEYKKLKLGEIEAMKSANVNGGYSGPSAMNQPFSYPKFGSTPTRNFSFNPSPSYSNWWDKTTPYQYQSVLEPDYPPNY